MKELSLKSHWRNSKLIISIIPKGTASRFKKILSQTFVILNILYIEASKDMWNLMEIKHLEASLIRFEHFSTLSIISILFIVLKWNKTFYPAR